MSQHEEYITLLEKLIATSSFSKEEDLTADIIANFFEDKDVKVDRTKNNVIVRNQAFDETKPTILLNSHHDTVKPNSSWRKDPFTPVVFEGRLYGLGSNDAGGCLISLISAFIYFHKATELKYNLVLAATAEEEISGKNGIEMILPALDPIVFAIVGEPTQLQMAIAEKGLMVLDCTAEGISGHAARNEGDNAIYNSIKDIEWFRTYEFDQISDTLGPVKMTVTQIQAGSQHNVVPDECRFVVDVRSTDAYTNEELLQIIQNKVTSTVVPRSTRLQSSGIPSDHSILQIAETLDIPTFGSPTLSDQALMPFPSVKIGPGDSARSHTADEFIYLDEIHSGIELYIQLLGKYII